MSAVYPQLFPKKVSPDMIPTEVYSFDKVGSSFFIPNCQKESFEEFLRVNNLAKLFFTDLFAHCLKPDGTINFQQVESWCELRDVPSVDEQTGRMKRDLLKNLHVIYDDNLGRLKESGGICPICANEITVLTTCPVWEIKLRYKGGDIDWQKEPLSIPPPRTATVVRERPYSDSKDFSEIHLIFLIDFVCNDLELYAAPPPDGLIDAFLSNDREYATSVLSTLRNELFSAKTESWKECLQFRSDLSSIKSELSLFLKDCPKGLYGNRAFTDYVLNNYPKVAKLKEIKRNCELFSHPFEREDPPATPAPRQPLASPRGEGSCMPIRYILLSTIFICSFLYFFHALLLAFFKSRFFFGDEI